MRIVGSPFFGLRLLVTGLALKSMLMTASATVTQGNSYGFGFKLDVGAGTAATIALPLVPLSVAGTLTADTGRLPPNAFGDAPLAYDTGVQNTVKGFAEGNMASFAGLSLGPIAPLNTTASGVANLVGLSGAFNGRANSDVDGLAGIRTAHGFGSIEGLRLDLSDLSLTYHTDPLTDLTLNPPPLVSFTQGPASLFTSDSTVTGDVAFGLTGSSVIANLGLSINGGATVTLATLLSNAGIGFGQDLDGNITVFPNTSLTLDATALSAGLLPGVTLGANTLLQLNLNKQVLDVDPNLGPRITTTALEIILENLDMNVIVGAAAPAATLNLTGNADIILGQSQAQLGVPESGTVFAGIGCLGLVGYLSLKARARSNKQ